MFKVGFALEATAKFPLALPADDGVKMRLKVMLCPEVRVTAYLKVIERGSECGRSGLPVRSRDLRELGTQGLVPAGRKSFDGFESCVGDDDSDRHECDCCSLGSGPGS